MSFRLIESYDDSVATTTVEGRTFPALCLVEDDLGIRWFLTHDPAFVNARTWIRAASAGASALISPVNETGAYAALTTEAFMDERTEIRDGYAMPKNWATFTFLPSFVDLVNAPRFGTTMAPLAAGTAIDVEGEPRTGLVHLHNHTEYSALDGVSKCSEITQVIAEQGGWAVGAADHGNCAGHPDLQKECDKAGLKPIFAMEAYFVDDRLARPDQFTAPEGMPEEEAKAAKAAYSASLRDYYHLVLIAVDDEGLRNLWAMSTESYKDGFYYKPRLDWDTLQKFNKGVIATTACLRGPLTHHALLDGDEQAAQARLGRLLEIFGERLYIEIHCNQLPEQIRVNQDLVRMARQFDVPLLAAVDAHYARAEDRDAHRVWLSMQTNSDIADESSLFAGGQDYHLKTEAEVRDALSYLGDEVVEESIANTARIAEMCTAKVEGVITTPIYSTKGGHEADAERLMDLCMEWWHKTQGKREVQGVYIARFEREFKLLVAKKFCGYFLMWADICRFAKSQGVLVGPGRGSGGGSLVAYLAGITDLDPVDGDLLFERFLTEGRTSLPDFDVDFPATKKRFMQDYCRERFGIDFVTVVGSVMRLKNKGVIDKLGKAMKSTLPENFYLDQKRISAIIEDAEGDTAGLGLSWEDLWAKAGDELQPYREAYPHVFEMADILVNRVNTFGQHAAGLVISTDRPLTGQLPLRRADEDGHMIAQFDKDVLEELGFVKFDLLTLRNLDTIQKCIDLIKERRGHVVNVYDWKEEYLDPQVWEEVSEAHTLGIFQIETTLGTKYAKRMQPRNLADLADLVTIVRPGPRNSGLTETYLQRRDGLQEVTFPDPRMATVLAKTYGCLLYQEDIMQACMVLGGYDSNEADNVRKILGKKKVEKVQAAGQEFITRAVAGGMDPEDVAVLWSQMAEFAKYSFNRAHAYAYAVLGYWCAWFKFHYPTEYLTAALSSVDKDRIPDFVKEARRMGLSVLPPEINESGKGFKPGPLSVRYGLDAIKGIGTAAEHIQAGQPFSSYEDFMERMVEPKGSKVNRGHVALLAKIGAFDNLVPNRRGLQQLLLGEKTGESTACARKNLQVVGVNGLPCTFDWSTEEVPVNPRTGKKTKPKAPPKKCTKACRQYLAPAPMSIEEVEPYTDADIRDIEQELLDVFLSSTPFDVMGEEERKVCLDQAHLLNEHKSPEGLYLLAGVLTKARPHRSKDGRDMGFLAFDTEVSTLDVVCFNTAWTKYRRDLKTGSLFAFEVEKNSRGLSLSSLMPISKES